MNLNVGLTSCLHLVLFLQAVYMVLEDTGNRAANMMAKLLKYLYSSCIVTVDQLTTVSYSHASYTIQNFRNGRIRVKEVVDEMKTRCDAVTQ